METFSADQRALTPLAGDEADTLRGFLNHQRDTLRWKCSGLTATQLATAMPPTTMTLGGLLKHLAVVESFWLNLTFAGGVARPSWFDDMDEEDPDWAFSSADGASPEQLFAWLDEAVEVSDRVIDQALAAPEGLGAMSEGLDNGQHVSMRWILCHLIEEYARHNGHADLLRESIDGATGE
jgi:uncharacterized damage-inducible protein DinB